MLQLDPDGLLLTMEWQFYSPYWAVRYLRELRPDLAVVDINLVRRRWYCNHLRKQIPQLMKSVRKEGTHDGRRPPSSHHQNTAPLVLSRSSSVTLVSPAAPRQRAASVPATLLCASVLPGAEVRYLTQLKKFDYDEPYDTAEIQAAFIGFLNALVDKHTAAGKPVYSMVPVEDGERSPSSAAAADHRCC